MVFVTNIEQNESYTFQEMMKQDDKIEFITAMLREIDNHESPDHWNLMRSKDIPPECLNLNKGKADIIMLQTFDWRSVDFFADNLTRRELQLSI